MSAQAPKAKQDPASVRRQMAREQLRTLLAHIAAKTTDSADAPLALHKSVYTSEERFAAEREKLFLSQPLVAGLSGDIPNSGDMILFDAAGPSILVMRSKDGIVRAFLNMCTHRGAKLVEECEPHSLHASRLACPFHAWTFDTNGVLIGQPSKAAFKDCPIGARDLIELPALEWNGLLLVRAQPGEPIDGDAHFAEFSQVLEALELHRAEPVKKGILTADSNWKIALDTYGESYHFSMLHATTIGQTHYSDIAAADRFGLHYRVSFPDKGKTDLLGIPEDEWPDVDYGAVHYLFPNTIIFFGSITPGIFFTQIFRLFPDGVGKTRCQFAVYAPFGITSDDYRATCAMAYDATAQVVQTEDYRVASTGYANLLTAPEDYHIVLGKNEALLQSVHRNFAEAIGLPLPDKWPKSATNSAT